MKILNLIVIIMIIIIEDISYAQISDVRVAQVGNKIEILYNLSENISAVTVSYSIDGGKTFNRNNIKSLAGDKINVQKGNDKKIVWNTVLDLDKLICENFVIKLNSFETSTISDSRNNKIYNTIKIGTQWWMAENLSFMPNNGKFWTYKDNFLNVEKYGYLYDWETAKNICPSNWHLPNNEEWNVLIDFLGGTGLAGGKIKATYDWDKPNSGANDESGFSALPGGVHKIDNSYGGLGNEARFWSSTPGDGAHAWCQTVNYNDGKVVQFDSFRGNGFSVRCIKN